MIRSAPRHRNRISATVIGVLFVGPVAWAADARDSAFGRGVIEFSEVRHNLTPTLEWEGRPLKLRGVLVFDGPRYAYHLSEYSLQAMTGEAHYIGGGSWSYIHTVSKSGVEEVHFRYAEMPPFARSSTLSLTPGLSLPLGAGFEAFGKPSEFLGELPTRFRGPKTSLLVTWSKDFPSVPTRAVVDARNEFAYTGKLIASPGVAVPQKCTYSLLRGGRKIEAYHWEFGKVSLGRPVDQADLMSNWYYRGCAIRDDRVNPPVDWTYEELVKASGKREGLTPEQLLKLSASRSKFYRRSIEQGKAKAAAIQQHESGGALVLMLTFIGVFTVSLLVLIGIRRLKKRT